MSGQWKREPGRIAVVKDASYRDGRAALAVVGDLGTHCRVQDATSATEAEEAALLMAMMLAGDRENVDFISDRNPVQRHPRITELLEAHPTWRVIAVPRRYTWEADRLAGKKLAKDRRACNNCGREMVNSPGDGPGDPRVNCGGDCAACQREFERGFCDQDWKEYDDAQA